jgi:hypothetical protein
MSSSTNNNNANVQNTLNPVNVQNALNPVNVQNATQNALNTVNSAANTLSQIKKNMLSNFSSFTNYKRGSLHIFENPLQAIGKTLDEYMDEIGLESSKGKKKNNENMIVKNEILAVFNKSKLNPDQFAKLLITNNIYIVNEKPGDWTRLKVNEVEEYLHGIREEIVKDDNDDIEEIQDDNKLKKEQSFMYNKILQQEFE